MGGGSGIAASPFFSGPRLPSRESLLTGESRILDGFNGCKMGFVLSIFKSNRGRRFAVDITCIGILLLRVYSVFPKKKKKKQHSARIDILSLDLCILLQCLIERLPYTTMPRLNGLPLLYRQCGLVKLQPPAHDQIGVRWNTTL